MTAPEAGTPAERLRFRWLLRLGAQLSFGYHHWIRLRHPDSPQARERSREHAFASPWLKSLWIGEAGQRLEAQLALPPQPPRARILLCHGIGDHLFFWNRIQHQLAEAGVASLVFHYPGYGKSPGDFTVESSSAAVVAAWDCLLGVSPDVPAFLLGMSMGTATSLEALPRLVPQPAGVILSQGFSNLRDAGYQVFRSRGVSPFSLPKLLPNVWRNTDAIQRTNCPILVVHSPDDELFPPVMGEKLFAAACERSGTRQLLVRPPGYSHAAPLFHPEPAYWGPVLDFIDGELNR